MNKRGNYPDVLELTKVIAYIVGIGIIAFIINTQFNTGFAAQDDSVIPNATKEKMNEYTEAHPMFIDTMFSAFLLMIMGFSIFAARLVPSSPKFLFVGIIMMIGFGILGLFIENFWYAFAENATLAVYIDQLTIAPFILDHMFFILLLWAIAIGVALYAKEEREPQ